MNTKYLNIYNNLIKLTRNKSLYKYYTNKESFSDRLTVFFFHLAFFLKTYKNNSSINDRQKLYDFIFKQIELSIREIGYGDATVNKKMKDYVNLMYSIVNKVELWEKFDSIEKSNLFSKYINTSEEISIFTSYFDKYSYYLSKKSFNYFTKDVISLKF